MTKIVQMFTRVSLRNGFRGAQRKTWDFYHHILSHDKFRPVMTFHKESLWSKEVPWGKKHMEKARKAVESPDLYMFKLGNDWKLFSQSFEINREVPIISPVVNFRVTKPSHYSHAFLLNKSIKVCPSPALFKSLQESGCNKEEIRLIPNGIDTKMDKNIPFISKCVNVLIVSVKNISLGERLYSSLCRLGINNIENISKILPHELFIDKLSQSKIVVHLPCSQEAHYLPGLEGMLQGAITIMPDCQGNSFYVENKKDSFLCDYSFDSILATCLETLALPLHEKQSISFKAKEKASQYSLVRERVLWHSLLNEFA